MNAKERRSQHHMHTQFGFLMTHERVRVKYHALYSYQLGVDVPYFQPEMGVCTFQPNMCSINLISLPKQGKLQTQDSSDRQTRAFHIFSLSRSDLVHKDE